MAELAAEFLPPGVFNVICGDRDTGAGSSATRSRRWSRSPAVGPACRREDRRRRRQALHLELGGKAPVIIFDDADVEAAAEAIAVAGYFNAGQDCTAATRVLAGPRVHDDFAPRWPSRPRHQAPATPTTTRLYIPPEQHQPARARRGPRRPGAGPRGCWPVARRAAAASSSPRPSWTGCSRTTSWSRPRSSAR